MNSHEPSVSDMACKEFLELITAYLDEALPSDVRAGVDEHLDLCEGCQTVLAQLRTIIALSSRLTPADVDNTDEITRDRLSSTLRDLRRR